jgi:hypothetical protein
MIIGQNTSDPALSAIAQRHQIPCFIADTYHEESAFYHEFASSNLARLYPAFFEFCVLANLNAAHFSDVVIDMNEISTKDEARLSAIERLKRIGVNLSLDDCKIPVYSPATPEEQAWISSERESLKVLHADCETPRVLKPKEVGSYWRPVFEGVYPAIA